MAEYNITANTFLTAKDVCQILNIKSLTTLQKYRNQGLKSYTANGRSIRYRLEDVLEFMHVKSGTDFAGTSSVESIG